MKKLSTILLIISCLFCMLGNGCFANSSSQSGDNGGNNAPSQEQTDPVYEEKYTYNTTHHWRKQTNGDGKADYAEHVNESGKCVCGKYFECPNLTYKMVTVDGITGYGVSAYDGTNPDAYDHIEIPAYYQGVNDKNPVRVIAIAGDVFSKTAHTDYKTIKSVKLNEGLLFIGNAAFAGTDIVEVVIPDSVLGGSLNANFQRWPTHGGLYNVFGRCAKLKKAVIGNGVTIVGSYTFSECVKLQEVKFGSNVREIQQRAFYECKEYKTIVLPERLVSIPEGSVLYSLSNAYIPQVSVFPYGEKIFMEMSESQYQSLRIKTVERDPVTGYPKDYTGNFLHPDEYSPTTYGIVSGWSGVAMVYYQGEWEFDVNGKPVVIK
ncbi:MAG: leucine-rich repeat domain-containing protein [Clostridia bacterium]|nr:leucine-rich repeat domain-containing protein [Clostridia bacterium]